MKQYLLAITILVLSAVSAHAEQLELGFSHPDEILAEAYPGYPNVHVADFTNFPENIKTTFGGVDIPFEMGDGYYGRLSSAYYKVFDYSGNLVGYMEVNLLSYTEGSEYFLGAAYVTVQGRRLDLPVDLDQFEKDRVPELPPELHPEGFQSSI